MGSLITKLTGLNPCLHRLTRVVFTRHFSKLTRVESREHTKQFVSRSHVLVPSAAILDFAGAGPWSNSNFMRPHKTNSAVHFLKLKPTLPLRRKMAAEKLTKPVDLETGCFTLSLGQTQVSSVYTTETKLG